VENTLAGLKTKSGKEYNFEVKMVMKGADWYLAASDTAGCWLSDSKTEEIEKISRDQNAAHTKGRGGPEQTFLWDFNEGGGKRLRG